MTPLLVPQRTWLIYDSTKLKCWQDCNRKYFYEYILGWRPDVPGQDLVFGRSFHVGMAILMEKGYSAESLAEAATAIEEDYRKDFDLASDDIYFPKTPGNAINALIGYAQRYKNDFEKFKVLHTEIGGTVPIRHDRVMHFKMDTILQSLENGKYSSLEHKTTKSSFNRQYNDQWYLSVQTGAYNHVLNCLYNYEEVGGVIINSIQLLKTKCDYQRIPIRKTVEGLEAWLWDVNYYIDRIGEEMSALVDCEEEDNVLNCFVRNTENCTKYWGCPYHNFCMSWANPLRHITDIPTGFREEFWDPSSIEVKEKMDLSMATDFEIQETLAYEERRSDEPTS
ncbi:PD-(D/E)XK endonuclease-like domain-containing protein [Azospirillaceae bacterium]